MVNTNQHQPQPVEEGKDCGSKSCGRSEAGQGLNADSSKSSDFKTPAECPVSNVRACPLVPLGGADLDAQVKIMHLLCVFGVTKCNTPSEELSVCTSESFLFVWFVMGIVLVAFRKKKKTVFICKQKGLCKGAIFGLHIGDLCWKGFEREPD